MVIKNLLAETNAVYSRGDTIKELKGIIITSATMNGKINDFLDTLDVWAFFAKCPHYIIENNGIVYQTLPVNYKGKYCGGIADKGYIQIVVDEPVGIKYLNKDEFTVPDLRRAKGQSELVYSSLVELCTHLCLTFKLDPLVENTIISQAEGRKKKLCSDYSGIDHIWKGLGLDYSMTCFRKDVIKALNQGKGYYYDGIDYSYVFNPEYYLKSYPYLVDVTGISNRELFAHFIIFGMKECKKGSKDFDVVVYRINNPDLKFGDDWCRYYRHYCEIGRLENRKSC